MSVEAMKQALECIRCSTEYKIGNPAFEQSEAALHQAIAEAEKQEPAAWRWETHNGYAYSEQHYEGEDGQPLYTHPQPKREWVGLNWDESPEIYVGGTAFLRGAKWAEAKLKEKNT